MDPRALTLARRRLQRHLFLLPPPSMPVAEVLLVLLVASLLHAQPASSQFCNSTACSDSDALRLCAAPPLNRTRCSPRVIVSFPFFTSDQCLYNDSSFVIADCNSSSEQNPRWPGFTKHAMTDARINETFITHLFNPFSFNQTGSSEADNATSDASNPLDSSNGYMNLTWNNNLQEQSRNICEILASPDQISEYIPSSIDLRNFAQGAFHFDPSNIILLFNCTVPEEQKPANLNRNSSACAAYGRECNQNGDGGSDCYQYSIPSPGQNLSLPDLMNDWGCKRAMFFVRLRAGLPVRTWAPGLMRLSWGLQGTAGLGPTLEKCVNCSSNDGLCSYDSSDNFQCLCGSGCSAEPGGDSHKLIKFITLGIAGLCLILVVPLIAFLFCKKKKAGSTAFYREHNYNLWRKRPSFLSRKPDPDLAREISYNELICATESFTQERILGYGAFGAVYNGVFADGLQVAVKRLHHDNYRRMELFYNEIKVLSSINHPNLVKLYGFCVCEEERELLLVFEYASQGTVSDHIHNGLEPPLSWSLRLNIACETADALSYLHNTVVPPIYHRDVKTANILLDDNFHVKLADFGLSKLVQSRASSHISTSPQGTPGYLDPEYHQCYQLTDKSDVYSLGVVLMELISGKPAVDMTRVQGEINLSAFAVMKVQCGLLEELVDPNLQMEKDPTVERSVKRVVELAFECLHICRDDRPSMRCVAETLAHIRQQHKESAIAVAEKPFPSPGFSLASTDSSYHSSNLSSS